MTLKQLAKKHRNALAVFNAAYVRHRRAIVRAQRAHMRIRRRSSSPKASAAAAAASARYHAWLLKPLIRKNQKI
jgi:hypothetical protein